MNKPATKEPSMDEILSSIRQIIADDDQGIVGPGPEFSDDDGEESDQDNDFEALVRESAAAAEGMPEADPVVEEAVEEGAVEEEPLELMAEQIVAEPAPEMEVAEADDEDAETEDFLRPAMVVPEEILFEAPAVETPQAMPKPEASVKPQMSSMPDPALAEEMVEQLIEPATTAAVRHAFGKLGTMGLGAPGVTIESMIREMLRPMLKDWLDENLPSVVESMVEREIERLSRGSR